MSGTYDFSIEDFPRLAGENSDSKRIMRAVEQCERGVLYFPKGVYEIDEMLEITNSCSLLLHNVWGGPIPPKKEGELPEI